MSAITLYARATAGFDERVANAVAMLADQSRDAAERALGFFRGHYQGDALDNRPLFALPPEQRAALTQPSESEFLNAGASI